MVSAVSFSLKRVECLFFIFQENKTVYLIFSIQGSNYFQGIARVAGPVTLEKVKEFHAPGLGGTFPVQWIRRY